jgi:hypothetical protein
MELCKVCGNDTIPYYDRELVTLADKKLVTICVDCLYQLWQYATKQFDFQPIE